VCGPTSDGGWRIVEVWESQADVMDREGIKPLLGRVVDRFPRLSHLWVDAGYNGQDNGADWVEKALGWTAEIVRRPPKAAPQEVMKARDGEGAACVLAKSTKLLGCYLVPNNRYV
jgi:hypothetical protein